MESPHQPAAQPTQPRGPLIIIGASARAAAQSALRAGYEPWCIDLFADRDLRAIAPVKRCPRQAWPNGVLELMKDAPPGPVLLTGAMENHLEIVDEIYRQRPTLTHPPAPLDQPLHAMSRVRAPTAFLRALGSQVADSNDWPSIPRVMTSMPWYRRRWRRLVPGRNRWLVKPMHGAGGRGIRFWRPGERLARNHYLQEFIEGVPVSAVFVLIDGEPILAGATEQIIGDADFGAAGFHYAGNVGPFPLTPSLASQFQAIAAGLAAMEPLAFRQGVMGIDAIVSTRGGAGKASVFPVEVNPRYVASVEVLERFADRSLLMISLLAGHPVPPILPVDGSQFGKAVIHARRRCRAGDLSQGQEHAIADVPDPGEVFEPGQPVCTVFARGSTRDACFAGLRAMAEKVYTRLVPA